jgi:hypothetical protein
MPSVTFNATASLSVRNAWRCSLIAIAMVLSGQAAVSQEIAGGQRIAVQTARVGWIEGKFQDIRGDTVVLTRSNSGAVYTIPYDSVLAWRVPDKARLGRTIRSSLLGGVAGAMAGVGVGFEGATKVTAPAEMRRHSVRFGIGGMALGAALGVRTRWRDVNVRLARGGPGEDLLVMQTAVGAELAEVSQNAAYPSTSTASTATDRDLILRSELESVQGVTALDAIRRLRPHFLSARRAEVGREALVTPLVYLDGVRLGELGALQQIQLRSVLEIQYYSPTEATMRWGMGHGGGVIHVILRRA